MDARNEMKRKEKKGQSKGKIYSKVKESKQTFEL